MAGERTHSHREDDRLLLEPEMLAGGRRAGVFDAPAKPAKMEQLFSVAQTLVDGHDASPRCPQPANLHVRAEEAYMLPRHAKDDLVEGE